MRVISDSLQDLGMGVDSMDINLSLEWPFIMKVLMASACGMVVGLERQIRGKPAGIRTSILVCLGTATFVQLGFLVDVTGKDPNRIIGQVVTGIGFLGAGVILTRDGLIKGVTSAAVIWILAAIGALIGAGFFVKALLITSTTIGALVGVEFAERAYSALRRGVHSRDPGSHGGGGGG